MKKMLIAVAVVLAAGLMTSCNKGEGCYRLDWKVETSILNLSGTTYVYGEGEDIDKAKQDLKDLYDGVKITQTKVLGKNAEDCEAMNE